MNSLGKCLPVLLILSWNLTTQAAPATTAPSCLNIKLTKDQPEDWPFFPLYTSSDVVFYRLQLEEFYTLHGWFFIKNKNLFFKIDLRFHPELGSKESKAIADGPEYRIFANTFLGEQLTGQTGKSVMIYARTHGRIVPSATASSGYKEEIGLEIMRNDFVKLQCPNKPKIK